MKRAILLWVCLALLIPSFSLRADGLDAVVRDHVEQFTMASLENGTLTVHRVVEVLNENGLDAATLLVYTDQFQNITAFSGSVSRAGGKPESLKKKDLISVSIASGIAQDGFMTGYQPRPAGYPCIVTYDYTVQYKRGFAVFPDFPPVVTPRTRLEAGSYTLLVPADVQVRHYTTGPVGAPTVSEEGKTTRYQWSLRDYNGLVIEHDMPPIAELLPSVHASPDQFVFDGVRGSQASWQDLGAWHRELLQGTDILPVSTVSKVREMTANAGTDLEKVRILYDWFRHHTRYVSIQFGIGGFKPFTAETVDQTGFGDCKALSNYFKALLAAVGVASDYVVLNTHRRKLITGYCSFGQTDHAMLAVPLPALQDTLWIESTNPSIPLGYRHDDIAGHEVILIGEAKSQVAVVRSYPDSVRMCGLRAEITIHDDGSADLEILQRATADATERWIDYGERSDESKRNLLVGGLDGQAQNLSPAVLTNNFDTYDGRDWYPSCETSYRFNMRAFGRKNGDRMMIPVNPFSKRMEAQRGERIHPLVHDATFAFQDTIILHLPMGYQVENLPTEVHTEQEWGRFDSEVCTDAPDRVIVTQTARMKSCRTSPDRYKEYREFVRALNRAYTASVVLRKAE